MCKMKMMIIKKKPDKENINSLIKEYVQMMFDLYNSIDNSLTINNKVINLRNEEIKKVSIDYDFEYYFNFFSAISDYRERLKQKISQSSLDFLLLELKIDDFTVESRIKNINSIFSKIYQYINIKKEHGSVAINKCINDLFGLRIIVPLTSIEELHKTVVQLAEKNKWHCRITNASKSEYKAIHMYLLKDNYSLPWEVQFWLTKDDGHNRESHAKYKQAYTSWEFSYNAKDLYKVIKR